MESRLFLPDLLTGHEPRWNAGLRPGALAVESTAPGRRPALQFTGSLVAATHTQSRGEDRAAGILAASRRGGLPGQSRTVV
jgi:hypothetical protein